MYNILNNHFGRKVRFIFIFLFFICCFLEAYDRLNSSKTSYPNIIFILADDMGMGDPGCYNPESKILTPNIDSLTMQGIRFSNAYAPASVCSPTRYGVLTGWYMMEGWRHEDMGPKITEKVIWFIEDHLANHGDEPFYLHLVTSAPHRPCLPPGFFRGRILLSI